MLEKVCRKGKPTALFVGMYIGVAAMENNMKVPQKTENRTTIGPSNPTPGYIIKKKKGKNTNSKRCIHPNVYSSIIYNCHDIEAS